MISKKTEHYEFYFEDNSYIEKNINDIIEMQENCYSYICELLRVDFNNKIEYYLCISDHQVGEIYGDNEPCNGFASYPNKIYAVYNEDIKCIGYHEDVHIIAYNTLGNPNYAFIKEGLAMFFDKTWWGISNTTWTRYYLKEGKIPKLYTLIENSNFYKYSDIITYPIVGALTEYIISTYGIETYKKFYTSVKENFNECFEETFGISFIEMEQKFIKYLNSINISDSVFEIIEKKLRTK